MKLISLTSIAMLTSTLVVAMPIEEISIKQCEMASTWESIQKSRAKHCLEMSDESLENKVDVWSTGSSVFKIFDKLRKVRKNKEKSQVENSTTTTTFYNKLEVITVEEGFKELKPLDNNYFELIIAISEFNIYQNVPANEVTISLDYLANTEVKIFDSQQNLVSKIQCGGTEKVSVVLDISNYADGSYFVTDGKSTMRFEK